MLVATALSFSSSNDVLDRFPPLYIYLETASNDEPYELNLIVPTYLC
jgi:hypothetical protein